MAGENRSVKCPRCKYTRAIQIRDGQGWEVSCRRCGFLEEYYYQGALYRLEIPIAVAHYMRKDTRDPNCGRHEERYSDLWKWVEAENRLRNWMKADEVYPDSVYMTHWNMREKRVEFDIGGPDCLDWEPPRGADVPNAPQHQVL